VKSGRQEALVLGLAKQYHRHSRGELSEPLRQVNGPDRFCTDLAEHQVHLALERDLQAGITVMSDLDTSVNRGSCQQAAQGGQEQRLTVDQQQVRAALDLDLAWAAR
jgi:hypothetical protein